MAAATLEDVNNNNNNNNQPVPKDEAEQAEFPIPEPGHSHPPDAVYVDPEQPEGYNKGQSKRPRRLLRRIAQAMVDLFDAGLERISTEELFELIQEQTGVPQSPSATDSSKPPVLLVDARRADEFYAGHISGAVNHYPLDSMRKSMLKPTEWQQQDRPFHKCTYAPTWTPTNFAEFDRNNMPTLIVYDAMGLRAGILARRLIAQGFPKVKVLKGCFYKWVDENRPLCSHPDIGEPGEVLPQHGLAAILIRKDKRVRSPWEWAKRKSNRKNRKLINDEEALELSQHGPDNSYRHNKGDRPDFNLAEAEGDQVAGQSAPLTATAANLEQPVAAA